MHEIDSTFCKVHQSACSGRKEQAIGVSRGGKNTKIHVLTNERMQLLNVVFSEAAVTLLKGIKLKGKIILADKAYNFGILKLIKRGRENYYVNLPLWNILIENKY